MNDDVSYNDQCQRGRKLADEVLKADGCQAKILAARFCCDIERGIEGGRGVVVGFIDRLVEVARNTGLSYFVPMLMSIVHIV